MEISSRNYAGIPGAFKLHSNSRSGFEVLAMANKLALDPHIAWAEPDMKFTGKSSMTPNDPGFNEIWGIKNTGQFNGYSRRRHGR